MDPRPFQIAALSALLGLGLLGLEFDLRPSTPLVLVATALGTQYLGSRWQGIRFDPRSALISALSLCLLLRTDSLLLAAATAGLAVGSKFGVRVRGKHLFNPTNFGLVAMLLLSDGVWVSPGQWGSAAFFAFAVACAGLFVLHLSARSDVTIAFLTFYLGSLFGRALWLGDPLAIPLHQLESGALLIFAFFMISDPKTTPDSRAGRVLFAALVAFGAMWVRFGLWEPNGLLYSLVACAFLVPALDRLLPAERYRWRAALDSRGTPQACRAGSAAWPRDTRLRPPCPKETLMKRLAILLIVPFLQMSVAGPAYAFCGFYVARADTKLFNDASQVVLVRDGDRTVITMANDYRGELDEFAIVIPVPTFIRREQIHVTEKALIDHLDAYTAPRLVEYFDEDPCRRLRMYEAEAYMRGSRPRSSAARAKALGVTVEAAYTVGEYDILILSAEESGGLSSWLRENGYRLPEGADRILGSYLKQDMRFFVAKVNLGEQSRLGHTYLRPLQIAYETPKFMLPIRLGTLNADGTQELYVYTLTRKGRVETTNYRTVKLPTGMDLPVHVKDDFGRFYRDMFAQQVEREDMRAVFLEYAWDMAWCDPCAADPLSYDELRELGVFWLDAAQSRVSPAQQVFVTRLHLRYDEEHFPEDLVFQETGDRTNFQGRYVLRHAWKGTAECSAAAQYVRHLPERHEREVKQLAALTGWDVNEIRRRVGLPGAPRPDDPWWQQIWD